MSRAVHSPVKILHQLTIIRVFEDGAELDGFEALAGVQEKESRFRMTPSGRNTVGIKPTSSSIGVDWNY